MIPVRSWPASPVGIFTPASANSRKSFSRSEHPDSTADRSRRINAARNSLIFTDLGIVTTTRENGPALTRTMLTELAANKPDVIVFELGDGLLGAYGVDSILECPDIRSALTGVVLSANDPVAAWGGVTLLRDRFGIDPCVVTGPSTDNAVGVQIIQDQMKVAAFNALGNGAALGDHLIQHLGLTARASQAANDGSPGMAATGTA